MKKRNKLIALGVGILGATGIGIGIAMAKEGEGGDDGEPGTPNPRGTGTWTPDPDDYAGGGAGGRIGGRVVDGALRNEGRLPPGSILITGPNMACRVFAIGYFFSNDVDYGIVGDPAELDKYVQEEALPDRDITTADCSIVGVAPNGEQVRAYISPPLTPEQMGEALRPIAEFSGQM